MTAQISGGIGIGLCGLTLNDKEREHLEDQSVGSVILFKRNFKDRQQLCALIQQIKEVAQAAGKKIIIATDQEGGRVQRFATDGFTRLPAMRRLGELWDQGKVAQAKEAAASVGYVMAAELRACGVDLSLAPVLDLNYPHGSKHVIGDRAFHANPEVVVPLAECLLNGMERAGMANCAKHFPGHGYVEGDSHHTLPQDERTLEDIKAQDMVPYEKLKNKLTAVMGAWITYPKVDENPAALSSQWIKGILRKQLGFEGAVFSDAVEMKGAGHSFVDAAKAALMAGCDMAIYGGWQETDRLLQALKQIGYQFSEASLKRLSGLLPQGDPLNWDALQQHPDYIKSRDLIISLWGEAVE